MIDLHAEMDWVNRAACAGVDPDLFFPEKGDAARSTSAAAKRVCAGCVVRSLCLQHALENRIKVGIWGGLSPKERRLLVRSEVAS